MNSIGYVKCHLCIYRISEVALGKHFRDALRLELDDPDEQYGYEIDLKIHERIYFFRSHEQSPFFEISVVEKGRLRGV